MAWQDYLFVLPYSTLFIFAVNVCVVIVGSLVFRRMVNTDRLEAQELEVRSYDRSLKEAQRKNDKVIIRKLKREEPRIKRISASVSKQRLKTALVLVLPFSGISFLLSLFYVNKEIVLFPFEFFLFNNEYSFTIWYFLTYLTAYFPISRIFKTSPNIWSNPVTKYKK